MSTTLTSERSSYVWRNLVWIDPAFWLVGIIVDLSNGSGYDLEPDRVSVTLVPVADGRRREAVGH